jgi:hypothetical protein
MSDKTLKRMRKNTQISDGLKRDTVFRPFTGRLKNRMSQKWFPCFSEAQKDGEHF